METYPKSDQVPIMHEGYWTLFIQKEKSGALHGFMEPFRHIVHKWSVLLPNVFSFSSFRERKSVAFHLSSTFPHT